MRMRDRQRSDGSTRPISALTTDGVKLAGTWHPAARGDTGRTTLLLHGFAEASGALQAQRVAALCQAGWNVAAPRPSRLRL